MVKASGRKKRRFLPEKAEGKQLEATNSESGKMHHRTPWLTFGGSFVMLMSWMSCLYGAGSG